MNNRFILSPFFLDEPLDGLKPLMKPGWQINEPILPEGEKQDRMSVVHRPLAELVLKATLEGQRPVSIAGDCCTAIGVLAGLQRAEISPALIWFDAHGDFNTWETTPSGFLGGMPLAMIVGRGEQRLAQAVGLRSHREDRVILTDARDLDPGEREAIRDSKVRHLPEVERLFEGPLPEGPLYIHFDTDVVSPQESPAQNYLAPGGPTSEMMQSVFKHLAHTHRIAAVSLSSWNPELDKDKGSERVSLSLLQSLVGEDVQRV